MVQRNLIFIIHLRKHEVYKDFFITANRTLDVRNTSRSSPLVIRVYCIVVSL
ncbi:unnamed protein product [Periconia digitata]|uniref:Uncharacterized protein n=1 Tax=Periconia digitata TaxID=1303443 RepID=A0A9W4UD82_9PLEO|nr:unnamed protein product [Periconia digitata]